jgi:hypothetical protein
MDIKNKKKYIYENNYQSRFGNYKSILTAPPKKNNYDSHFSIENQNTMCDVIVRHQHGLDLVRDLKQQGFHPVLVSNINTSFDGNKLDTFDGFLDEYLLFRTNYCKTVVPNIYPLHGPEVMYNFGISIIRDERLNFIDKPVQIVSFNQIIISPIEQPKLQKKKLKMNDYMLTKELVETIFQTAIMGKNDVLILNDFSCKQTKIPIDDILFIYNMNILKYGHYFKYIFVCVPLLDEADRHIYAYFEQHIIKPQHLVTADDINIEDFEN